MSFNPALPTLADTDVTDALGAGADLSFERGGAIPSYEDGGYAEPEEPEAPDTTGEDLLNTGPAPAAPVQPAPKAAPVPADDGWEKATPEEASQYAAPVAAPNVPLPRRPAIREPEVPGREPVVTPNPEDGDEWRPASAEEAADYKPTPHSDWKSQLRTGTREFLRGAVPNLSSLPAAVSGFGVGSTAGGAITGGALAAAGLAGGPIAWGAIGLGALLGGLTVGGAAGSMQAAGSRAVEDELLQKTGMANKAADEAEDAANPEGKMAGQILAGGVGLSPSVTAARAGAGLGERVMNQVSQRGAQAVTQAGMAVGQEEAQGQPIDWKQAAGAGALGAALPGFNRGTNRFAHIGEGGVPSEAPAPAPAPAAEPQLPLAVPVGKPYGPNPGTANDNTPAGMRQGPFAAQNDNNPAAPPRGGAQPPGPEANDNPASPNANDNFNFPPTQDNQPGGPQFGARPQAPADFYMRGAPDFTTEGGPEGSQSPRGPGSPEMPLSGEIMSPDVPDPWSPKRVSQTPDRPALPGRPDTQLSAEGYTPPEGGPSGSLIPGVRGENTAPAPRPGLTAKSMALIAKSKQEGTSSTPPTVSRGTAFELPAPTKTATTIGNDMSPPYTDRSLSHNSDGRGYAKDSTGRGRTPVEATTDDGSGFTPDVAAVMTARTAAIKPQRRGYNANDNSTTPGKPGVRSPGMSQEAQAQARSELPYGSGVDVARPANRNAPPGQVRQLADDMQPEIDKMFEPEAPQRVPGVQETKSAGAEPVSEHPLPEQAAQPAHPAVAQRSALQQQAMDALRERKAYQADRELADLERSGRFTDEHAQQILQGIAELEKQSQHQAVLPRTRTGVIARSETTARKKDFKNAVADKVLKEFAADDHRTPTPGALRDRLNRAIKAYHDEMTHAGQPVDLSGRGKMGGGLSWLTAARKLLQGPTPSRARIEQFMQDEFLARHSGPDAELIRETRAVEGDAANKRQSPDERAADEHNAASEAEEASLRAQSDMPDNPTENTAKLKEVLYAHEPEAKFRREMTPDEIEEMHDKHRLTQNLISAEHAQHQEQRGTQRQRYNTPRSKAERLSEIDHNKVGTKQQRATAKAALDMDEAPREKSIWEDQSGELKLGKIKDDFIAAKDYLGDLWQRRLGGNALVPARQGKMGSDERALARVAESAMSTQLAWGGQRDNWHFALAKAHSKLFNTVDDRWNPKGSSRAAYVDDRNYKFMDDFENGRPQPTPELQAAADFFKKGMNETFEAEKLMGSTADFRDNYIAHMFENDKEAARFDDWMANRYGPKWFQKERGYDTLAEARENGFKLRTSNPSEIYTARMAAGTNFLVKQRLLQDLKNQGNAYGVHEEDPRATLENGWTKIVAPNGEQIMLAPEVMPMWRNAIDREGDFWKNKKNTGTIFRGWMGLKALWVPVKLALSGFHLGHIAFIHSNAGATFGEAFNGQKNAYKFPTSVDEAGKAVAGGVKGRLLSTSQLVSYPPAAVSRIVLEPLARSMGSLLREKGFSDPFTPLANSLKTLSDLAHGARVMDAFNDPNFKRTPEDEENNRNMLEMGLQATSHIAANLKVGQDIARAVGVRSPGGVLAAGAGQVGRMELISKSMFHLIQMWKATQATTAASALLAQHPEYVNDELLRRTALRELGKNIDDLYSEAFHPAKLWGKTFEGLGRAAFLSLDWQSSQISQFGGAVTNQIRSLGSATGALPARNEIEQAIFNASPKTTQMVRYVGGAMLMSGLMSYALSGETPSGLDYVFPRVGGLNTDGSPRRLSLPQWTREGVMFAKHWGQQGMNTMGAFLAASEMVWSKTVLAPIVHAVTNRDFFNREMHDPNAPFWTQIGQHLGSMLTEVTPISYESAKAVDRTGGSKFEQAMSYAGMPPAPRYIEKSDTQNRIAKDFYDGPGAGVKPYAAKERDSDKSDLLHKYDDARQKGDTAAIRQIGAEIVKKGYQKASNLGKHPAGSSDQYMFERLPRDKQKGIVRDMDQKGFSRYVLNSSYLKRGDAAYKELTAYWKELGR